MQFCDITISYNQHSGGIRTYIEAKKKYLLNETKHRHLLIVPGVEDSVVHDGRSTTVTIAGPCLPGQRVYRYFSRMDKVARVLAQYRPEVIELGSFYLSPWIVFRHRRIEQECGRSCLVTGYFHTDVATAYAYTPLKKVLPEKAALLGGRWARWYIGNVFKRCDVMFAASERQAAVLKEYGVTDVHIAPLGVDLDTFSPDKRSQDVRERYGAEPDTLVLAYLGRLCVEKGVDVLLDAYPKIAEKQKAVLWLIGGGPLLPQITELSREFHNVHHVPHISNRETLAQVLASADLYITAGPFETFGLSIVEAQASGLPIIGVKAGALLERVQPGLGLLGQVGDSDELAANVELAASKLESMHTNIREHAMKSYDWDTTCADLIDTAARAWEEQQPPSVESLSLPSRSRLPRMRVRKS